MFKRKILKTFEALNAELASQQLVLMQMENRDENHSCERSYI